jgi:hypothetical protein
MEERSISMRKKYVKSHLTLSITKKVKSTSWRFHHLFVVQTERQASQIVNPKRTFQTTGNKSTTSCIALSLHSLRHQDIRARTITPGNTSIREIALKLVQVWSHSEI